MRPVQESIYAGSKTDWFLHILASQLRYECKFLLCNCQKPIGFCIFHFTSAIMLLSVATLVLVLFCFSIFVIYWQIQWIFDLKYHQTTLCFTWFSSCGSLSLSLYMQSLIHLNWASFRQEINRKSVPETLTKHQKSNAECDIPSKKAPKLRKTSSRHLRRPHKTSQDASKAPQASPKTVPGGIQDPPKHFKAFQETPKWVQADAKSWQTAPQAASKRRPRYPKTLPT